MRKVAGAGHRCAALVGVPSAMVVLLCFAAFAIAQQPPLESPIDNPFPAQQPGFYQPPDEQMLPAFPPGMPQPAQPQAAPTTWGDLLFGDNRQTPEDYRSGAFQKLSFINAYLPRMGADGFGIYELRLTSTFGLPCPTKDAPLAITPAIDTQWLSGPAALDIPAQLHEVSTEFRWLPKIGDNFRADIAVQPGYFSDWDGSSVRAVRVMGHGSGIYDWTPTFQIVLGCAYLDRPDIELLPIAGVIWKPDAETEYRLVFPAPKISWLVDDDRPMLRRFQTMGIYPQPAQNETWLYIAGELGGGSWAIRHSDGTSDLMSYSDIRVFLGLETRSITTIGSQIEIGYVFHRYIRLTSTDSNFDLGDALMVRAALNY